VINNHLHIITHDVPYPADFGGVIDIFYKIKALHAIGVKIQLHCFVKNRPQQVELEKYCETVTYYKRKGLSSFSFELPYIVSSRKSNLLLDNLRIDNYPILFEGVHGTYHLYKNEFANRKLFIRTFNVEHIYYDSLAKNENNLLKKVYYLNEARVLKKYESIIIKKAYVFTLSENDSSIFKKKFNVTSIEFLPVFLPYEIVKSNIGKGLYCLYHANLSINENENAAIWLIENVFKNLQVPLIVAGLSPSKRLIALAAENKYVSIVNCPTDENLQLLIEKAQINILPSFNSTGVKLKLLNALFNGRYCLVNNAGAAGSAVEELCEYAETPIEFIQAIKLLFAKEFTAKEMQHRSTALKFLYNNENNALLIRDAIR
jgi:hypothetical protein